MMLRLVMTPAAGRSSVVMLILFVATVLWPIRSVTSAASVASFYGSSYISIPWQSTSNKTELDFRFKSSQPDAFLILAAGSSDYIFVAIEKGQLAVKINFGTGEYYLVSEGPPIDDLHWHRAKLKVAKTITLIVDAQKPISERFKQLPASNAPEHELDIRSGIFLGSQATFKSLYFGQIPPFRGCLDDVVFNDRKLLDTQNVLQENVVFSPKCDEQFSVLAKNSTISFIESNGFLVFDASQDTQNASRILFDFRTISTNAILLFAVSENQRRFLAIELVNSKIRLSCDGHILTESSSMGSSSFSSPSLSDAHWHRLEVTFSSREVVLSLDGKVQSSSSTEKIMNGFLFSQFFIGGLSSRMQPLALNARLQSALVEPEVTLKGCLRNLKINSRDLGLQDASISSGIAAGKCRWHFLCESNKNSPCISGSKCLQFSIKHVKCLCDTSKNCVRPEFKHKDIRATSEFFARCNEHGETKLSVGDAYEGSTIGSTVPVRLSRQHFDKLLSAYERPGRLMFKLHKPPKYGIFRPSTFTLDDVDNGAVAYEFKNLTTSKSVPKEDLFVLKVDTQFSFESDEAQVPNNAKRCNETLLSLSVEIGRAKLNSKVHPQRHHQQHSGASTTPQMSDEPTRALRDKEILLTLKMSKNSKKVLSFSMFREHLLQATLERGDKPNGQNNAKLRETSWLFKIAAHNESTGIFERVHKPEISVTEFTENDLKSGTIRFVHRDGERIEVNIRAFSILDKIEVEFLLMIEVTSMEMVVVNNSGLQFLTQDSSMLISSANLSFTLVGDLTASRDLSQAIKYEIVSGPQFGSIQKMRTNDQWINATRFSQRQIDRSKIRYRANFQDNKARPIEDPIQLRVTYSKDLVQSVWFVIAFLDRIRIVPTATNRYRLAEEDHEVILDSSKLAFQSEPKNSALADIMYTLLSVPFCGSLYLAQGKNRQVKLQVSSVFTQKDIEDLKLAYQRSASFACYNSTNDLFDFEVSISGSTVTQIATFTLMIEKDFLVNEIIKVWEGDRVVIDQRHLLYKSSFEQDGIFWNITRQPKYGTLQLLGNDLKTVLERAPTRFSQEKIINRRLVYVHDDSETEFDDIDFVVLNHTNQILDKGRSKILVQLKNDNPPTRSSEKPFNIVRNGQRRILQNDLEYVDTDLNTQPQNILYSKTYFPNGILLFDNGTVAEQFSQQDINNGVITFHHNGSDIAKSLLWVTDGQFYLSGSLEIRAADPFIDLVHNSGLRIKFGESCFISLSNLSISSNFDFLNKSNVVFQIKVPPKYGFISVNEKQVNRFTLEELEDEIVEFVSNEKNILEEFVQPRNDSFQFVVSYQPENGREFESSLFFFSLQIFPESFYELKMVNMNNITVFESKTIALDTETLLVENYGVKEDRIFYTIVSQPKHGMIHNVRFQNSRQIHKTVSGMTTFTQEEINRGYIMYRNYELGEPNERLFLDQISFEVTNQVVTLKNLTMYIDLIPKSINIVTSNLTVLEGNSVTLGVDNIEIVHPYYRQTVDEFIIIEESKYGQIYQQPNSVRVKSFNISQLENHEIFYKQDSSEVERDWFTLVARSNLLDKESFPATLHVLINRINDESPRLVNNSMLTVWEGEQILISSNDLATLDPDTPAAGLLYTTFFPNNGYIIDSESNTTVAQFTQEDINLGRIWFVHVGAGNGSFRFSVSDGDNSAVSGLCLIRVKTKRIELLTNDKLLIAPGAIQSITKQHLLVQSSSPHADTFTYRMVKGPMYGKVYLESSLGMDTAEPIDQFTQTQVDRNQVVYKQTRPLMEPLVFDKIVFNVESPNLPTLEQVHFVIEIAVESLKKLLVSNIDTLIKIDSLVVDEGRLGILNSSIVDFSSFYRQGTVESKLHLSMTQRPEHGIILKNGFMLEPEDLVPAVAFKNGSMVYKHDDSDTLHDQVSFDLFLLEEVSFALSNFTIPIVIISRNDEFPVVLSRMPVLRALQNMKTLVTNQTLNTRDKDGNPGSLIYEIRSNGSSRDSFFTLRGVPVIEFTQADIDQERVYFNHKTTPQPDMDFWFRVRDHYSIQCSPEFHPFLFQEEVEPSHCTLFYPIKILLSQLTLQLVNHTAIELKQGSSEVTFTKHSLATLSKSASPSFIVYRIRQQPKHGYVSLKNGMKIQEFTQSQIDSNDILYVQTNFTADDEFYVDILHFESKFNEQPLNGVKIRIETRPLVKAIKPFLVARPGDFSLLSYEYLDASELALRTESNPLFHIISPPAHGEFKILDFSQHGERIMKSLTDNVFTQEDIIRNRIVYVAKKKLNFLPPNEMLIDVIGYRLSAANVQTANGVLVVNLFNNRSTTEHDNFSMITERVGSKIWVVMISPEGLLMLGVMFISLLFVIPIFLLMRRCRTHSNKSESINFQQQEFSTPSMHPPGEYSATSRSSSNSGLGTQSIHTHRMPIDSSCENLSGCDGGEQRNYSSISQDNISPLPPPSLYFINESNFSDDSLWASPPLFKSKHGVPRSSGDGTSNSKCSDLEADPSVFEDILRNNAILTLDRNLEKMKQKTLQGRQPPYWI